MEKVLNAPKLNPETESVVSMSEKKTLIISLPESFTRDFEPQLVVDGKVFELKKEMHVTVINFSKGKEIVRQTENNPALAAEVDDIVKSIDWTEMTLLPDTYHISQNKSIIRQLSKNEKRQRSKEGKERVDSVTEVVHRESIIQMIDIPGLAVFYEKMNETGINLGEAPPAHVTLYTNGDAGGIGINSQDDLAALNPQKIEI